MEHLGKQPQLASRVELSQALSQMLLLSKMESHKPPSSFPLNITFSKMLTQCLEQRARRSHSLGLKLQSLTSRKYSEVKPQPKSCLTKKPIQQTLTRASRATKLRLDKAPIESNQLLISQKPSENLKTFYILK